MSIKIIIADDHPIVIDGLLHVLSEYNHIEVIATCSNGEALIKLLQKQQPEVLLLDIQMPGKRGDELAEIVSRTYPGIYIIALTNLDNTFYVKNMFQSGAKGYILKTADRFTLVKGIETVYGGNQFVDPILREQMVQEVIDQRSRNNDIPTLTEREKDIIQYIAYELTSQEIAQKLFISQSAVDNHRLNLMAKFGVKNAVGLIRKALQMGIIK